MQPIKFLQILGLSAALAGYSLWLESRRPPTPPPANSIPLVRVDEAAELWKEPTTLFVDVRPSTDYEFGHIAGAVHLPWGEPDFNARLAEQRPRLERARVIVVYCKSVDCGLSLWAAIALRNAGLTQVKIYPEGWNVWVDRGLPTTRRSTM